MRLAGEMPAHSGRRSACPGRRVATRRTRARAGYPPAGKGLKIDTTNRRIPVGRGTIPAVFLHPHPERTMGLIGTLFVGLIVGAIARFLMPGEQKMGWIMTMLLGVGGSLVAGYFGQVLGWYHAGQGAGWIASVVGAVVLLFAVGKMRGKPSS